MGLFDFFAKRKEERERKAAEELQRKIDEEKEAQRQAQLKKEAEEKRIAEEKAKRVLLENQEKERLEKEIERLTQMGFYDEEEVDMANHTCDYEKKLIGSWQLVVNTPATYEQLRYSLGALNEFQYPATHLKTRYSCGDPQAHEYSIVISGNEIGKVYFVLAGNMDVGAHVSDVAEMSFSEDENSLLLKSINGVGYLYKRV